jgi:hypothetical protein
MENASSTHGPTVDPARAAVRHLVATLAYRASKVIRDVSPAFGTQTFGAHTRPPVTIVAHMADLIEWAARSAGTGQMVWKPGGSDDWTTEVRRFFNALGALDAAIVSDRFAGNVNLLIQAPLADALTHVGQLAMLRGMAGLPVRPERYRSADVVAGRVGIEQTPSPAEFDGDASRV